MKLPDYEKQRRAKLLIALREKAELSQTGFAGLFKPGDASFLRSYWNWESGKHWNQAYEATLANFFGVEPDYFSRVYDAQRRGRFPQDGKFSSITKVAGTLADGLMEEVRGKGHAHKGRTKGATHKGPTISSRT